MADATVLTVPAEASAAVLIPTINGVWDPIVLTARYAPEIALAGVYSPNIVLRV